jgi:hypothetical protein
MKEKGEMKKLKEREEWGGNTIIVGARDEREEKEEKVGCSAIGSKCER